MVMSVILDTDGEVEDITLSKENRRGQRRKADYRKAIKKRTLSNAKGESLYDNLSQYSKGKVRKNKASKAEHASKMRNSSMADALSSYNIFGEEAFLCY